MSRSLTSRILSTLFIVVCCFGLISGQNKLYVHAPSGLNLRASSNPSSAKLATISVGTMVELVAAPSSEDMVIDNLPGGMAKVKADGKIGYMFSGYLLPYPTPTPGMETEAYVNKLRRLGISYTFETHRIDNDGHVAYSEVFYLNKNDFRGAWLVAQRMYKISPNFKFPSPDSRKEKEIIENPDRGANVWGEQMIIDRKNGEIVKIEYFQEREGGGWSITIEPGRKDDYKEDKIRIDYGAVAD